jgi:hypothetical protein
LWFRLRPIEDGLVLLQNKQDDPWLSSDQRHIGLCRVAVIATNRQSLSKEILGS